MKPIATALRRIADWLDDETPFFHIKSMETQPTPYPPTASAEDIRKAEDRVLYTGRPRGIPAADRGDALDFEWDELHGEDFR